MVKLRKKIFEPLIIMLYFIFVLSMYDSVVLLPIATILLGVYLIIYTYCFIDLLPDYFIKTFVILFFSITILLPFTFHRVGAQIFYHIFEVIISAIAGFWLSKSDKKFTYYASLYNTAAFFSYLFYEYFRGNISYDASIENINSGSNLIGYVIYIYVILYSFTSWLYKKKAPIFVPLLSLILCIELGGRIGIFSCLIILTLNCLKRLWSYRINTIVTILVFALTITVFLSENIYQSVISLYETSRFRFGLESERWDMLYEYLSSLDIIKLIFGSDYDKSPSIELMNKNPHNSYVRAHYLFGLPYILSLIIITQSCFRVLSAKRLNQFYGCMILFVYLGRAFFDTIAFPSIFDVTFYYIVFTLLALNSTCYDNVNVGRSGHL